VSACVCVSVRVYTCVRVCKSPSVSLYGYTLVCMCLYTCVSVCLSVCLAVPVSVSVYAFKYDVCLCMLLNITFKHHVTRAMTCRPL